MANLTCDLFLDGDFFELLTDKELEQNIFGGAVGAGSVSAGQYVEKNGVVLEETALTSTVASSRRQPFTIELSYSFAPRLSVSARVY